MSEEQGLTIIALIAGIAVGGLLAMLHPLVPIAGAITALALFQAHGHIEREG